jgi:tripartite-type tricarboxylate transporter receptor subunit TctC
MMSLKWYAVPLLLLGAVAFCVRPAIAQKYPSKPVRILVGYAPGGGVDTTARIVAAELTKVWRTQVIIENRPGAAGNIATELTAVAAPDGYTLVLCNIGSHSVTPARFGKRLKYDPIKDFAFPAKIGGVPNIFMVHPSMPVKSLREYIAYAKSHPGQVNFGSSGVGGSPHMSVELMTHITGIKIVHVPYKGSALALADVMAGHIESSIGNLAGSPLSAVKSGRLRGLAVTSAKRNTRLPDVPTFQEQGVTGFDVSGWYGLCTQSKVPQAIITKINTDVNKLLVDGSPLRKSLAEQAIDVDTTSPAGFEAHVKSEIARWTKVVKDAKLEAR